MDYYKRCSAAPLVPRIGVPCNVLFADDDPLVDGSSLDRVALAQSVRVLHTRRGGHMGFLGLSGRRSGYYWLDSLLLEWLAPHPEFSAVSCQLSAVSCQQHSRQNVHEKCG